MLLTKEQKDKEDNDAELKRCEEAYDHFQELVQSSQYALWIALLTINGIFIAFTLSQDSWSCLVHLLFIILFIIPALIVLLLFYFDNYSIGEFNQAYLMVTIKRKKDLREQDTQHEASSAIYHDEKACKVRKWLRSTGKTLEKIAIFITGISIIGIFLIFLFN